MSNLLKYNSVIIKNDNKLVIDSNKMAAELISQQAAKMNFAQKSSEPDQDGFVCGLDAATVEQLVGDAENDLPENDEYSEKTAQIIEDAGKEAEQIIADAHDKAEKELSDARRKGYDEGMKNAEADVEKRILKEKEQLSKEYETLKADCQKEYEAMKAHLEPELVNTLLEVFMKVTKVIAEDDRETILTLVNSVMENTELSKEFVIHACDEDCTFLENNKDKIYGFATSDINIEISRDNSLKKNQCQIETDAGVFDCSLDIQLENLAKEIRLLSCINS